MLNISLEEFVSLPSGRVACFIHAIFGVLMIVCHPLIKMVDNVINPRILACILKIYNNKFSVSFCRM